MDRCKWAIRDIKNKKTKKTTGKFITLHSSLSENLNFKWTDVAAAIAPESPLRHINTGSEHNMAAHRFMHKTNYNRIFHQHVYKEKKKKTQTIRIHLKC